MPMYSNNDSKWLGQLCDTFSTAVTPICRRMLRFAESFSQPNTRCGSSSTGGPNLLLSLSQLGVCIRVLWGCAEGQLSEMGRLELTDTLRMGGLSGLAVHCSQRSGNWAANAAKPPVQRHARTTMIMQYLCKSFGQRHFSCMKSASVHWPD